MHIRKIPTMKLKPKDLISLNFGKMENNKVSRVFDSVEKFLPYQH